MTKFYYLNLKIPQPEWTGSRNHIPTEHGSPVITPGIGFVYMVEVEVTLRLTASQSVCLGIEHPCGACDQTLLPVAMLLSEICGLVSIGRPL
jgi:hypothetical protein